MTDELDYNSFRTQFCLWGFVTIFLITFLYGEYIKPFFLAIDRTKGSKTPKQPRSLVGKFCNLLLVMVLLMMVAVPNLSDYCLTCGLFLSGLMYIFDKYMWKQ